MTLALHAAVPATRLLRGEPFLADALASAACIAIVAGVMAAFGYLGASGDGGYGMYAMNLLSPLWPAGSGILGWPWSPQLDATGHGGWEGYNWLGLGLLAALVVGVLGRPLAATRATWRDHGGLTLVLIGLSALAITHKVGFGPRLVLDMGEAPGPLEQFRASGRFFWPVAYGLLLGAMLLLARIWPVLCLAAGLLQFADAAPLRAAIADWAGQRPAWDVDAPALREALAGARSLTLLPSWPCVEKATGDETYALLLQTLTLASEHAVPASTMYAARWHVPPSCRDKDLAEAPLAPGELRLILPSAQEALAPLVPGAETRCAPLGGMLACR